MNDPNHWYVELMVRHKMQEVERDIKQAQLLKEAGLSGPGLLARGIQALRGLLRARAEKAQVHHSLEQESYPAIGED